MLQTSEGASELLGTTLSPLNCQARGGVMLRETEESAFDPSGTLSPIIRDDEPTIANSWQNLTHTVGHLLPVNDDGQKWQHPNGLANG
jgi:hypothetical protein